MGVCPMADFIVQFKPETMSAKVEFDSGSKMDVGFGQAQPVPEYVGGTIYDGEYEITPRVTAQTMSTRDKVMLDDVTIQAIPVYETSNNSGGTTVYIAKEET